MPSPRRSTRSAVPPPPANPTHSNSSSSISSASQRNTRSLRKQSASPLTSDDSRGGIDSEAPPPRSTRRSKDADLDMAKEEDDGDNDTVEGSDITRCVCGHQEYPGPPLTEDSPGSLDTSEGDLFIQCDKCSVWQHGGCVGIMDESKTPDDYFCELCEKKLHQVRTDPKGQRYSRYLPVVPAESKPQRKTSVSKESEPKLKKERDALARASLEAPKRRSTMNSRQTYDEEEMLRKAIEESRGDNETGTASLASTRRGKRSRDESEDGQQDTKRQRKASESLENGSTLQTASLVGESDDDGQSASRSALKKARAQAAETLRERERRERDKVRDSARAEAAKGRSARAGRRRGDESDLPDETPNPEPTPVPASSQQLSPPAIELNPPSSSHKKGGKKVKRLGRNQYSKDRDPPSPTRKATNGSNGSADESNKIRGGDSGSTSKQSPSSANEQPVAPTAAAATSTTAKGKGRWKSRAAKSHDGVDGSKKDATSAKDTSQLSIKEMDRVAQYMLEYMGKNLPDYVLNPENAKVIEGRSMLGGANSNHAGASALSSTPAPALSQQVGAGSDGESSAPRSSAEIAVTLKEQIDEWRSNFVKKAGSNPGGLTV